MRQKYEGDPRTRSRMAQELKKLNEGTENLALEEEGWLPIEAAAGLTTGDVTENAAFIYWLGDYLSEELPARLDQRQLDILLLHGLDGLTYEEIGKIMGISGSRAHNIMKQVQILLEEPSFRSRVFYP